MLIMNKSRKSSGRLTPSSNVSEDRISDLPDYVIQHILSFLDTKDAIKTCVLSKRWESLWTLVPSLIFRCESGYVMEEYDQFASFVEKALTKLASLKTQKFFLECPSCCISSGQFDSWFQYAVNRQVEEVCLRLHDRVGVNLYGWPKCFSTNYSVTKMSLDSFWPVKGFEGFQWTSLKFLSLTWSILKIDTLRSILEGSPSMERLTLHRCRLQCHGGSRKFDASRARLKQLVMDGMLGRVDRPIDIFAPNLLLLNIVEVINQSFNLVDVSSLVEANMDFPMGLLPYRCEKKILKTLIQDLVHVSKLKVGIWWYQYAQKIFWKAIQAKFPPATRNVVDVDIIATMEFLPGLSALLYSLPDLEQLIINLMPPDSYEFVREDCHVKNPGRPAVKPFPIQHLKSVKIKGFPVDSSSRSVIFLAKMVEYLLANANILQKLTIYAIVTPTTVKRMSKIMRKLLSYPRASPDVVVLFESTLPCFPRGGTTITHHECYQ